MASQTDPIPILRTKLHRPPVAPDVVCREALHKRLQAGIELPLTLISAPAGYGKSTLASLWLEACDRPGAWVSLDEDDSDLHVFLRYLVAAIQSAFPAFGQETQVLLEAPNLPPASVLTRYLLNDLDEIDKPFTLVLDDYHRIHESPVHDVLTEVLLHPPREMHLALLTRRDPPLPINRLRARGQVTEIGVDQLRFTVTETAAFLQNVLKAKVKNTTAAVLEKKTEGWVTGLRLAALSLRSRQDLDRLADSLQGSSRYVAEYLVEEVVSRQPPPMAKYLLETSILDRFCSSLCEVVRSSRQEGGADDISGEDFIAWLEQANLFVVPLDERHEWFRYHHLFQELLQGQLNRQMSPEEISALHSRASNWFAENGLIDEAVRHALAAGDVNGAAQLVEQNRQVVLKADRWYVLEKWVARLPEKVRHERPEILLAMAWIAYHKFVLAEIPPLLERVEALIDHDSVSPTVLGELDLFKGYLYYLQGQGELGLKFAQQALDQLPTECELGRADAEIYLGLARQMIGQKDTAIATLNKKLRSRPRQPGLILTRLHATVAFVHLIAGELREAERAAMQLERAAKKSRFDYAGLWGSYIRGCCDFHANDLQAAGLHLGHVATNRYIHHTRAAISGMAGLALTHQAMQQAHRADEAIRELLAFAQETGEPQNLLIADSCRARISVLRGDPEPAVRWLHTFDETPNPPSMLFFLEIPSITQNRVLIATGSDAGLKEAVERLDRLWTTTKAIHNTFQMIEIGVLRALALEKLRRRDEALDVLEQVLSLAKPGGWIRPFVELGQPMADLLDRLLDENVAVGYVGELLAAFREEERRPVPQASESEGAQPPSSSTEMWSVEPLTQREQEILSLLAQGLSNKEIAAERFISPETVKRHVYNIYQKLDVHSRTSALAKARELGLLPRR